MKTNLKALLFLAIVITFVFIMYKFGMDIVLPWLMSFNNGPILVFGILAGTWIVFIAFNGVTQFLYDAFDLDEYLDDFFKN